MELEVSHENARALTHLFESLQVQRLVIGELDYSDAWSELRGAARATVVFPVPGTPRTTGNRPRPTAPASLRTRSLHTRTAIASPLLSVIPVGAELA